MMTNEGSTYIVNVVMVPVLGRGKLSHILKMHYLLKILLSTYKQRSDKLSTKEESTKFLNFMTARAGVPVLNVAKLVR